MIVNFKDNITGTLWEVEDNTPWLQQARSNKHLTQITQAEADKILEEERRAVQSKQPTSNGPVEPVVGPVDGEDGKRGRK